MMCAVRVALISSIIEASVVRLAAAGGAGDQHEAALLGGDPLRTGGSASSSIFATSIGMTRKTIPMVPRC